MVNDNWESRLWQDCHQLASELEAFDPNLMGFDGQLSQLEQGLAVSEVWIARTKEYFFGNESVVEISLKLNQIAGLYFGRKEFERAKVVAECAYEIHRACFGDEHEGSKVLAQNLVKLEEWMRPARLPKLWNFSSNRKDKQ